MSALAVLICSTEILAKEFSHSYASDNQKTVPQSLKKGFNYAVILEGKNAKVISWQNGNAPDKPKLKANHANNIVIAPVVKSIPPQYQHYPAGSVIPIDLPIAALMNMHSSDAVKLTLPIGQVVVVNDTVSEGAAGVMGHFIIRMLGALKINLVRS